MAQAIIDGAVTCEFAPIVDIGTGHTVGLEVHRAWQPCPSLLRHLVCRAQAVELLTDLELAAFREARKALRNLPEEIFPGLRSESVHRRGSAVPSKHPEDGRRRFVLGFSPAIGNGEVAISDGDSPKPSSRFEPKASGCRRPTRAPAWKGSAI